VPELPEVEVIRRGLRPLVRGKVFAAPRIFTPKTVAYPEPELFARRLTGRRVEELGRQGKFLLFFLDRGELVFHLRMTGRLVYLPEKAPLPHDGTLRLFLPFADGSGLFFGDLRKFGRVWLFQQKEERVHAGLHRLGPDIYEQVDEDQFLALLRRRERSRLKPLLLDQHFVAGLGNIYVDESLFRCGLHPRKRVAELSEEERRKLYRAIRETLEEGIRWGGTSTRDYRDARGDRGRFQERLQVYGRQGRPCRCGCTIRRIRVAGRGTYYCPGCQGEE